MKFFLILFAISVCSSDLRAATGDFDFVVAEKKSDEGAKAKVGRPGEKNESKESFCYEVAVTSRLFKDMENVEFKYVVFVKREELGEKRNVASVDRVTGSKMAPVLKPREKFTFSTNTVELRKRNLVGNFVYANGGKVKASDALTGIWIRAFQNGAMVAEFARPENLSREKWE